jgi:hypothetical protein
MGAGGVGVAATDTLGDTAGSSYGSEFGTGSDDLADNLATTDTMTVTSDDVLGDEGTSGVERER